VRFHNSGNPASRCIIGEAIQLEVTALSKSGESIDLKNPRSHAFVDCVRTSIHIRKSLVSLCFRDVHAPPRLSHEASMYPQGICEGRSTHAHAHARQNHARVGYLSQAAENPFQALPTNATRSGEMVRARVLPRRMQQPDTITRGLAPKTRPQNKTMPPPHQLAC